MLSKVVYKLNISKIEKQQLNHLDNQKIFLTKISFLELQFALFHD